MDYKEFNDFELVYYAKNNQEEGMEILYKKYEPLMKNEARRLIKFGKNLGLELNDFLQEGMLGLSKAVMIFDEEKETCFYTFAKTCIERSMITLITNNARLKHKILNESLSLEVVDEDGSHDLFGSVLQDIHSNPEKQLILKEEDEELTIALRKNLTDLEVQVFELKLNDFNYKEIADILNKDAKSIDNALQRIKLKLKEEIKKRELNI